MLLLYMAFANNIAKWVWHVVGVTLFCCFPGRLAIHLKMTLLYAFSVARCQLLSANILPTFRSRHKICNSWCNKERYDIWDESFCMVSCWAEYRNGTVQLMLLTRERRKIFKVRDFRSLFAFVLCANCYLDNGEERAGLNINHASDNWKCI